MSIKLDIEDGVATITIDRPERKNALNHDMQDALPQAFNRIQGEASVRSVILTGAGGDFCSGADVKGMRTGGTIADLFVRTQTMFRFMTALTSIERPVIAAVQGVSIGLGWSMALACDYVIAAKDARFQFAFRHIGLGPDGGATKLLIQNMGMLRAKELIYSGRFVSGEEAHSLGLATEVLPSEEVLPRARALAQEFAAAPTLALAIAKRQFATAQSQSYADMLGHEMSMQPLMFRTEDFTEGAAAFAEKRKPQYKGR